MTPIILPAEIDIIKLHLDHLTKEGPVQQRALYSEIKSLLESVKDFPAFANLLTALISFGKIKGYTFTRTGAIAKEGYEDSISEEKKKIDSLYIDGEEIRVNIGEKSLKKLIVDVLGAVEDVEGNVEIGGMKYSCEDKNLLRRFLRKWF